MNFDWDLDLEEGYPEISLGNATENGEQDMIFRYNYTDWSAACVVWIVDHGDILMSLALLEDSRRGRGVLLLVPETSKAVHHVRGAVEDILSKATPCSFQAGSLVVADLNHQWNKDKQQQHHAEFGHMQDLFAVRDVVEDRPQHDANRKIAKDGSQSDAFE